MPALLHRRLHTGRELIRRHADLPADPALSTASAAFDELLAGGLPRGRLVELVGRRSSGRFSVVLSALAGATLAGEGAALVDLGDGLDPQAAAAAGVVLERLLWVRPSHLKPALISAETLLTGGFALVVLDLGYPPVPGGRGTEAVWRRLARAARDRRSALLVASPYRVSGTAAAVVARAGGGRPLWRGGRRTPRLLEGLASHLELEKRRGAGPAAAGQPLTLAHPAAYTAPAAPPRRGEATGAPPLAERPGEECRLERLAEAG